MSPTALGTTAKERRTKEVTAFRSSHWPGVTAPGTISDQTVCLTDLLATFAAIVDVPLPTDAAEDSFEFLPVLNGRASAAVREFTFVQGDSADNAVAVRAGKWKLIETHTDGDRKAHALFDLTADPGETTDVARSEPEVVERIANALDDARRTGRTRRTP